MRQKEGGARSGAVGEILGRAEHEVGVDLDPNMADVIKQWATPAAITLEG